MPDSLDSLICLDLRKSILKKRLKLVDSKDLLGRVSFRIQIGDQWEYPIHFFFCAHGTLVDTERDRVNLSPGVHTFTAFGRTSLLLIRALIFARSVNLVLDQRLASFVLENALDALRDLLSSLEVVGVELRLNISQLIE